MPSIFDQPGFGAQRESWAARTARYQRYRAYYSGTAYDALSGIKQAQQLYAGIRTLFSPLRRVVRVDCAKVPAAWAMEEGAVSEATRERVRLLRQLSGAESAYARYMLYGAVAGDAALLLSGEPGMPVVTAYRPDEVQLGELADGTPAALVVKQLPGGGLRRFEYAMVITPEVVRTYRDGQLYAYGGPSSETPNRFGFVPVVLGQYLAGEDGFGEPAFAGVTELLDRVNEIASLTLDVIGRNAEPKIVGTGVKNLTINEGDDAIITEAEGARFYTLDPKLAIADTLAFIQDVRSEFKTLLPQLAIDELRGASDLAYDTVMMLLMELGDHIVAVRAQVDPAVEQVERWMLEANGGVPDDYALWRDRRWMTLSEKQQLELEQLRAAAERAKRPPQPVPQALQQAAQQPETGDAPAQGEEGEDA